MSVAIGALQILLDRGEQLDWFSSGEIVIEAVISVSAFYIFLVQTFTARNSFVNPRIFLDRNYAVSVVFIFIVGVTYLASLALMTPFLQTLMGYPVVTAGLVMGPRGIGTMTSMFMVGRLIGKIDTRALLFAGLALTAWAMGAMSGWTADVSQATIVYVGFVQGAGLGFLFVPLTTVAFATLPIHMRGEGTGLYNLSRNIGSAVGISVVTSLITRNTQVSHADLASYITPVNRAFEAPGVMRHLDPLTAAGRALLDSMITAQATVIAFIDDFKLLMILSIVAMPLVLLLRKPSAGGQVDHAAVLD